jgi:pimeloyl-ACP methyl ester carboxylesterase
VLLIHGLSSIAGTWWRIGPALAARGWDVTAVDQAGHGGRPVRGEVDAAGLAAAVLEVHPEEPDVLIGHSLGTVAAIGLLERQPGWAGTAILEEPPSRLAPAVYLGMAESITADFEAVRADRAGLVERVRRESPRWADEDVHWAVEGIAEMDPVPFARWLRARAEEPDPVGTPERILAAVPTPYVLAASSERPLLDGGSALSPADRGELERRLPAGHLVGLDGGHCLHRDAPAEWLAAVEAVLS